MNRLTTNKDVSEMGMYELAHNACYSKDGVARYRDFEMDMDARDFARNLMTTLIGYDMPEDDDEFDEEIMENLAYDPFETVTGLVALFYRNLWAMADLRETLKSFEDAEEHNGWIPCSEKMPPVETEVLVLARRKFKDGSYSYITTMAMYEDGSVSECDSCWIWEDIDGEYDEENDCYILPEGWWESRKYNPTDAPNFAVDDEVVAWQPLPDPYKTEGGESVSDWCDKCANEDDISLCSRCEDGSEYIKRTNADRIRSMSDEELAEFIRKLNECCLAGSGEVDCSKKEECTDCKGVVIEWLKSEVEE